MVLRAGHLTCRGVVGLDAFRTYAGHEGRVQPSLLGALGLVVGLPRGGSAL